MHAISSGNTGEVNQNAQCLHSKLAHEPPNVKWPASQHLRLRVSAVVQDNFKPFRSVALVVNCKIWGQNSKYLKRPDGIGAAEDVTTFADCDRDAINERNTLTPFLSLTAIECSRTELVDILKPKKKET